MWYLHECKTAEPDSCVVYLAGQTWWMCKSCIVADFIIRSKGADIRAKTWNPQRNWRTSLATHQLTNKLILPSSESECLQKSLCSLMITDPKSPISSVPALGVYNHWRAFWAHRGSACGAHMQLFNQIQFSACLRMPERWCNEHDSIPL